MTMSRYVDIDKVEWNKHYLAISNGTVVQETLQVDADYLNKLGEDVAPVVHARWIKRELTDDFGEHYWTLYYCSNCYHKTPYSEFRYCPDCGARMGEKKEG